MYLYYRSSVQLYNALRMTIQDVIDTGQFSVGDSNTKHVSVFVYILSQRFSILVSTLTPSLVFMFTQSQSQSTILRVVLQSLGSPLWLDEGGVPETTSSLPQFLHALRALMRRSHAVAVVSVPAHLMQVHTVIEVAS